MNRHSNYHAALNAAIDLANLCKREIGIEKTREFGQEGYNVRLLPNRENRFGSESRCEIVAPGTPKSALA